MYSISSPTCNTARPASTIAKSIKKSCHVKRIPITSSKSFKKSFFSITFDILIFDFRISEHVRGIAQPFAVLGLAVALLRPDVTLLD